MTKAVLEAESQGGAEQAAAAVPSPTRAVPASLHASLMARLDRLGAAKEVAQIGAAIGREFSHALLAAVARKQDAELQSAVNRLIEAGLLFRQGVPPNARDAAYGTLLREPRRALHARIAETLESQFSDIAESEPELLARHCTEAGLIERAALLWGKAGQRSVERSALFEAVAQLTRALDQITTLPSTPALRRDEIRLQVALITPLIHLKGYAAPETKAAAQRAWLLIEQAEALGEPPDDPLLVFSVLWSFWVVNFVTFNGDEMRKLAVQFLSLAEKQGTTVPLMIGHRILGVSLLCTGDPAQARVHFDRSLALYDPVEHRWLATRFGQDHRVTVLSFRSLALWVLGYPDAAVADADSAIQDAREIGHVATLMYTLCHAAMFARILCGSYMAATAELDQLAALAGEKGALFWKALGDINRGYLLLLSGKTSEAFEILTAGVTAYEATGASLYAPLHLSYLARTYAVLGHFNDAWRCIGEAMMTLQRTKQMLYEAEVQRVAGEIEVNSPQPDTAKAQAFFERALQIAREQQAKSWELRAAMSMARLWSDQGKPQQARELLAPIYRWFTEGFNTRDLKEAKALLDALS